MLTPEQINNLPPDTKKEYLKAALLLQEKKQDEAIRNDFLEFVKYMWPEFIEGEHHKIMADKFNKVASGEIKRLIINYLTDQKGWFYIRMGRYHGLLTTCR